MKKLFLIGDSIRMNYEDLVAQALEGQVRVYSPGENARFAAYTYYALGNWENDMRVGEDLDVVHWNVGLHDVVHMHNDDVVTPPEIYGYYLGRIVDRLEDLYPRAVKIFATSTPVREELHNDTPWFRRYNREIDRINEVAREVLPKRGVLINDLHAVIAACAPEEVFSDRAHFNAKGASLLAEAVLRAVCPFLDAEPDLSRMDPCAGTGGKEMLR